MDSTLILVDHPVLQHQLAILRDKNTSSAVFRRTMNEMSRLVAYEATRDLAQEEVAIETPLEATTAKKCSHPPIVVSIMRAGNGMLDGLLSLMPFASAGHIGIYRDKFLNTTVEYYFRLPRKVAGKPVLLIDPLVATGDTAVACIERLNQYKAGPIRLLCLLISEEGLAKVHHFHPNVTIYAVSKERGLNENGYLLPGIGDAGDRLYENQVR